MCSWDCGGRRFTSSKGWDLQPASARIDETLEDFSECECKEMRDLDGGSFCGSPQRIPQKSNFRMIQGQFVEQLSAVSNHSARRDLVFPWGIY